MIERLQSFTTEQQDPCDPRICRLDSDPATDVIDAIASDTARTVLCALHEEPRPVSQLADELDMSIPAINYHLENLEETGLVREVDTWYSSKGNEMTVYGPAEDPLVFVGNDEDTDLVRSAATRVGAAVLGIAAMSVLIHWLVTDVLVSAGGEAVRKAAAASSIEGATFSAIPPGLLFFSGGTFVLALTLAFWYARARRPTGGARSRRTTN